MIRAFSRFKKLNLFKTIVTQGGCRHCFIKLKLKMLHVDVVNLSNLKFLNISLNKTYKNNAYHNNTSFFGPCIDSLMSLLDCKKTHWIYCIKDNKKNQKNTFISFAKFIVYLSFMVMRHLIAYVRSAFKFIFMPSLMVILFGV